MGHWEYFDYTYHISDPRTYQMNEEGANLMIWAAMSEAEQAVREIKAQGYEIVGSEEMPSLTDESRVGKRVESTGRILKMNYWTIETFTYPVRRWVEDPVPAAVRSMYCMQCGQQIPSHARFCPSCGTEQSVASSPPAPPPASSDINDIADEALAIMEALHDEDSILDDDVVNHGYEIYQMLLTENRAAEATMFFPLKHCWVAHRTREKWLEALCDRRRLQNVIRTLPSTETHLVSIIGVYLEKKDIPDLPTSIRTYLIYAVGRDLVGLAMAQGLPYHSLKAEFEHHGERMFAYAVEEAKLNVENYRRFLRR